ncbi:MAG TPA: HlyD family efflux transporter periplasmic adaptor subunit, partial [Gemmatimonadales bacterium]
MIPSRRGALLLLLALGCGPGADEPYEARGTVEVPEVDLSALAAARVLAVRVEEGASVQPGDTVALLTQIDLPASIAGQRARIAGAEANLRDLEAGSRPEEIARAEAELRSAEADVERTTPDLARLRDLVARDLESRQALDHAVTADQVARGRAQAAAEALRLLRAGSRPERIQGARAEVANARAALAQIEARATDLVLTSPVSGIILSRNAEPGEALTAGIPVVTVGETARPYVRVFLPQWLTAGLRVGAPV